ncbi:hypothetical protein PLANPX_5039 [Lacipirellula parvula]|uniref:Uncharacterized protein n=1 Tax=Lacipirellula parvula TaxID=2650471 RepID=A0A5K7XHF6_9BACT|nr:hypothetical protein PLANPX_5039 [Lacipirellula parvula]
MVDNATSMSSSYLYAGFIFLQHFFVDFRSAARYGDRARTTFDALHELARNV